MKILWVTPESPYPPRNGVRVKCYNIIETLKDKHEFDVVYYSTEDEIYNSNNVKSFRLDKDLLQTSNYIAKCIGLKNNKEYQFFKDISKNNYDIVVLDTIKLSYLLNYKFIKKFNIAYYLTDSYTLTLRDRRKYLKTNSIHKKFTTTIKEAFYSVIENKILNESNNILVVSNYDRVYLEKKFSHKEDNLKVVPNGVNIDYFRQQHLSNIDGNNSIGYIGSLGEGSEYCLWFLKNVFPLVISKNPNVKFHIIGRGPSDELIKYSSKFFKDNVIITGEVDDVRVHANLCDIIISPVLKTHGILNKVLEGFSMGKPVIGTKISFNGIEFGENNKHFISCENKEEFASSIIELLNDKERMKLIGNNARNLVEKHYTWNSIFINLFESLIK